MSIQSEIERINWNVANAYTALLAKGATTPSLRNTANLASTIESIPLNAEAMSIETIWEICGYDPNPTGLPDGYTLLEYIQSSGTQYFDTGVIPTANTKIELVVSGWPASEVSTTLFGTQSSSSDRYEMFIASSGVYRSYYAGSAASFASSVSYSGKVTVTRDGVTTTIEGVSVTNTKATLSNTTTLFVLAHNSNGSARRFASVALYSCKIYDNGVLIRDYVPCINPDGIYGLFDKVNAQFYCNAGSGAFTGS